MHFRPYLLTFRFFAHNVDVASPRMPSLRGALRASCLLLQVSVFVSLAIHCNPFGDPLFALLAGNSGDFDQVLRGILPLTLLFVGVSRDSAFWQLFLFVLSLTAPGEQLVDMFESSAHVMWSTFCPRPQPPASATRRRPRPRARRRPRAGTGPRGGAFRISHATEGRTHATSAFFLSW